jgi:DNA-directed RNA polymerase alpha subunit
VIRLTFNEDDPRHRETIDAIRAVLADSNRPPQGTPLAALDLDAATVTRLRNAGIETVEALKALSCEEIAALPNFHTSSYYRVKKALGWARPPGPLPYPPPWPPLEPF